ncbi:S41 family peptidase [Roseateles oligotrophus]|uniref:S41 family peptidase n=1 Tax=Roseateles oligotrophus TaxID=1769250 RepID=A0ABT2Y9F8_9BURK|nr:S41 family peptidase [Roseateles oligotrophus]MCV2366937.1 S41 family peptidase [Roseateles oligotrophus]
MKQSNKTLSALSISLATASALLLSACGDGSEDSPVESKGPLVQAGKFEAKMTGAWRVLGEGRLIEVDAQSITSYQETPSFCYRERISVSAAALEGASYQHSASPSRTAADIYLDPRQPSSNSLERLAKIPDNCKNAPPSDAASSFKAMQEMFDLDYAFFKERGIDWSARMKLLAPKAAAAKDDAALQQVLLQAIDGFNDFHLTLMHFDPKGEPDFYADSAASPTVKMLKQAFAAQSEAADFYQFEAAWHATRQQTVAPQLSAGSNGRVLNGAMVWGKLAGNIGYIELARLSEFAEGANASKDIQLIRAEMDRALLALADTKTVIVDIAVNDGGYDHVSAEVAGSFADRRRPAFSVEQQRPQGRATQQWFVEPRGAKQYLKPVYLLTSDRTVSAGDTLTLFMRELPNVTHVGQATSGSMSNKLVKSLPGNFLTSLSNEKYRDPRGELFEGRGIPPKLKLQVFDPTVAGSLSTGHAEALAKLIAMIPQ